MDVGALWRTGTPPVEGQDQGSSGGPLADSS